ncbi:MAG: TonB-dependent receptor, partial [Psychrosphaera sp.]|nr:TonB-dependent receptor [Psychrosphaera sp.]
MKVVSNNSLFRRTLIASALLGALSVTAPVMANDNFSGTVKGHITAGANATVVLKHQGKGLTRTIVADSDGNYILRKLPIGRYLVTISKPGFESVVRKDYVVKLGGQVFNPALLSVGNIEKIEITGSQTAYVDLGSSTGSLVVTQEELALLPVNTGFNSVVLLAPGATKTSGSRFGGSPNIGGASSAENGYYLNGINITNIRTGLGVVDIPFAAVAQTEAQVGGISSEFGNALGGIINSVSKSGSNEFKFGVKIRHDNEVLRSRHDDLTDKQGDIYSNIGQDESDFSRISLEASGPIIEDQLFFYAMLAPQQTSYWNKGASSASKGESTSDRYMAKLDWYINDNHSLEFTHINFENEDSWDTYNYDQQTQVLGEATGGHGTATDGGTVSGIKYTALLSDSISLEMVAGRVVEQDDSDADNLLPRVSSNWANNNGEGGGSRSTISSHSNSTVTDSKFTRDQFRADLMWDLDEHQFKFGVDYYDTHIDYTSIQNGIGELGDGSIGWWYLRVVTDGNADRVGLPSGSKYITQRVRRDFSDSHVKSTSIYAQDSWQATDDLVLNLGVRVSNFASELSTGESYAEVTNQVAPRMQAIYDLTGDGSSKVFATWGRYFQPISANMNITQGGSRHDEEVYYAPGELETNGEGILLLDGSPSRGAQTGYRLSQDSALVSPTSVAHNDLQAMYSDEITFGYQQEVFDGDMTAGVRVIHRELKRSIEDANLGEVLNNWYEAQGLDGLRSHWVLFNPGAGLDLKGDFNGDGNEDHIELSAEEMGMPAAHRTYGAVEFTLKGKVTEKLTLDASYTWSHLWGNTAGLVNQDDNQADPGWTVSYDYAGLQDHASGNLPSDRRHVVKLHGTYSLTESLTLGFATTLSTGTPINYMGIHPDGVDSCAVGAPWEACRSQAREDGSFYDEAGNPTPRG